MPRTCWDYRPYMHRLSPSPSLCALWFELKEHGVPHIIKNGSWTGRTATLEFSERSARIVDAEPEQKRRAVVLPAHKKQKPALPPHHHTLEPPPPPLSTTRTEATSNPTISVIVLCYCARLHPELRANTLSACSIHRIKFNRIEHEGARGGCVRRVAPSSALAY